MIVGTGIDICENDRIKKLLDLHGDHFTRKIFTEEEINYCMKKENPVPHFAARFAFKEAFIKAMQCDKIIPYKEIGLKGDQGKKIPSTSSNLTHQLELKKINNIQFSITHADNYSAAIVILEAYEK